MAIKKIAFYYPDGSTYQDKWKDEKSEGAFTQEIG
tara:strand:- start:34 stop:138 length:105 start_codon:yes stop_codon:yes gene_type:complete